MFGSLSVPVTHALSQDVTLNYLLGYKTWDQPQALMEMGLSLLCLILVPSALVHPAPSSRISQVQFPAKIKREQIWYLLPNLFPALVVSSSGS